MHHDPYDKFVLHPRTNLKKYERTLRELVTLVHQVAQEGTVAQSRKNMKKQRDKKKP